MKQQNNLCLFLEEFNDRYKFLPVIEIENECTLLPGNIFAGYIDVWNNSPKLSSSGMRKEVRIKPVVLKYLSSIASSWFKFVVSGEDDWKEIQMDFIDPGYIRKDQIILMPLAYNLEELEKNRSAVIAMAIEYNVRYSSREQLVAELP